jgi:hypothetical protein
VTNGAEKGRKAEREVARIIQDWWRKLDPECQMIRTPLSGGWSSPTTRANFRASGDLMTTSESWPFTVEVKRREAWNVARLFAGESSPAWGWWRQAVDQAREESGTPMLWCRKNQYRPGQPSFPWLVMLPADYLLAISSKLPRPDVRWTVEQLDAEQIDFAGELPALWFAERLLAVHPKKLIVPL